MNGTITVIISEKGGRDCAYTFHFSVAEGRVAQIGIIGGIPESLAGLIVSHMDGGKPDANPLICTCQLGEEKACPLHHANGVQWHPTGYPTKWEETVIDLPPVAGIDSNEKAPGS